MPDSEMLARVHAFRRMENLLFGGNRLVYENVGEQVCPAHVQLIRL